jgi:hypothetical protein
MPANSAGTAMPAWSADGKLFDFTEGTHPIATKVPLKSAERSDVAILPVYDYSPWFFNLDFFSASFSL